MKNHPARKRLKDFLYVGKTNREEEFKQLVAIFQVKIVYFETRFLHYYCFVLFDSLRPINNLSVKQGRVFLG